MDDWSWCMQPDDRPEIWQYEVPGGAENRFDLDWIQQPVHICRIRKFGIYHSNRDYHVVVIPKQGVFFIDGKKYRWQGFDPSKPTRLVYGRLNRAHISTSGRPISRDPPVHIIGYRQEKHHAIFKCMGVSTSSGTYGYFEYGP